MTKATILQSIEEMENKLAELRATVEKLPEATGPGPNDILADSEQEDIEEEITLA